MGVVAFMAAAGSSVGEHDSQPPCSSPDCTTPLISILPCVDYITGNNNTSSQPTNDCCLSIAAILGRSDCLCQLFRSSDYLGFPINQTLAFSLPAACNINASAPNCTELLRENTLRCGTPPQAQHLPQPPRTSIGSPSPSVSLTDTDDTVSAQCPESSHPQAKATQKHGSGAGGIVTPVIMGIIWYLVIITILE
eukprot:PITA_33663